jgi:hypothetical protein
LTNLSLSDIALSNLIFHSTKGRGYEESIDFCGGASWFYLYFITCGGKGYEDKKWTWV